jgi:hypothetical protein
MESQVKSQISNKLYVSQLEKIEDDDIDANSELFMIPVSGRNIRIAPGKSIMDESGIAYCYVYVIQQDKVICKLGVYEKKSDTMPMFFDLSTFPEGSLLLFEEYEMNPSKLIDLEMKEKETETNNVFDYLIRELFPKIKEKRNTLKKCYSLLFGIFSKDDQDKDMKPILKIISATSKEKVEPTEAFLQTLKEKATDKNKFALTLLALQSFFNVEFQFKTDTEYENVSRYEELKQRWSFNASKIIEVNIDTYEMVEERDKDKLLSVIPEETSVVESVPVKEIVEEEVAEPSEEPVEEPVEEVAEPSEEPVEEPVDEVAEPSEEPAEEPVPEEKVSRPAPVRKGRTPKIGIETKTVKKERRQTPKIVPRGTSMNTVIQRPSISLDEEPPTESISLNDEPSSMDETKKTRKKTASKAESATVETGNAPVKIKIKRISKPKTKSEAS